MMAKRHGRFITLEGIEGVGKTTNLAFVADRVKREGHDVTVTREPGGTKLAEKLRDLVLGDSEEPVTEMAELLMIFAARSQHIENVIRPALAQGTWVICDRFTDCTFAYQGVGRGLPLERIEALADWVQRGLWPDLTLLLDADPALSTRRRRNRGESDRIERQRDEFFARARAGYLDLATQYPKRIAVIDAGQSLQAVQHDICAQLDKLF